MIHLGTPYRRAFIAIAASLMLIAGQASARDSDALARQASWQPPSNEQVQQQVIEWLDSQNLDATIVDPLKADWMKATSSLPTDNVSRLVETMRTIDPRVETLAKRCSRSWQPDSDPMLDLFSDATLPAWTRANLRLYYASWLAHEQLYKELHQVIADIPLADVFDPAALLFFQGVAQHRRLDRDACLVTLAKLLENDSILPRRYAKLARLMQADLEPLKTDSLDEISRIMDNIQVTLGHGRAGKQVRSEEEEVISKLDKLIKKLEDQANSAAAAAAASGGNPSSGPSQPMQDSMPVEQKGPGNVNPKDLGTNTDWGNLPPKEREEALQQLGRDLPSHYRDVIEEYFRKLAREKEE